MTQSNAVKFDFDRLVKSMLVKIKHLVAQNKTLDLYLFSINEGLLVDQKRFAEL
jgi:hypothetical protein